MSHTPSFGWYHLSICCIWSLPVWRSNNNQLQFFVCPAFEVRLSIRRIRRIGIPKWQRSRPLVIAKIREVSSFGACGESRFRNLLILSYQTASHKVLLLTPFHTFVFRYAIKLSLKMPQTLILDEKLTRSLNEAWYGFNLAIEQRWYGDSSYMSLSLNVYSFERLGKAIAKTCISTDPRYSETCVRLSSNCCWAWSALEGLVKVERFKSKKSFFFWLVKCPDPGTISPSWWGHSYCLDYKIYHLLRCFTLGLMVPNCNENFRDYLNCLETVHLTW